MAQNHLTNFQVNDICQKMTSKLIRDDIFRPCGLAILEFMIVPTENLPSGAAAGIDYYRKIIYINTSKSAPVNQLNPESFLAFALAHEMKHFLFYHADRQRHRDQYVWNIACDFVINLLLKALQEHSVLKLLDCNNSYYTQNFCFDDRFTNMLEEEVYTYLTTHSSFKKKEYMMSMQDLLNDSKQKGEKGDEKGKGGKDPKGGGQNEGDLKVTETSFKVGSREFKHTTVEFPKPASMTPEQQKKVEKDLNERAMLGNQMMESLLGKGIGSADLQKHLRRLFKVKVDWKKITADSIRTVLEKSWEMSWGKPSKIWMANPGTIAYRPDRVDEETLGTVVVSMDESGSMGDEDVAAAVDIIYQSKEYYKNILVLKHDTVMGWWKLYENREIDTDELLIRRQCGGTSHKEVFEFIRDWVKSNPDSYVSCYISISDLDSDIEYHQSILPRNIPRIYLTNNNRQHEEIIGKVINING